MSDKNRLVRNPRWRARTQWYRKRISAALVACAISIVPLASRADETGVSFWLPGTFGSLAAVPGQPGFQWATTYYHTSVGAGVGQTFEQGGRLEAGLNSRANLFLLSPGYTFASPVLNGRLSVGVTSIVGPVDTSIAGTLSGPRGNTISGSRSDALASVGDLYPIASLKWNQGTSNFMTYLTGDIPVGAFDPARLSNIGIGHGAIDGGAGYTYFDPLLGYEFSAVAGLTYNLENTETHYQNGVDFHIDWAASKFLTKQIFAGLVGYGYGEPGCDSGSGARLGCFKSSVVGIGPQVGYLFPVGNMQGVVNVKAYGEFANKNRPDGFNVWLTFAVTPAAPAGAAPALPASGT